MSAQDEIARLKERVRLLEDLTQHVPLRTPPGGGGLNIKTYEDFPDIPSAPTIISCKEQLWHAEYDYDYWKPMSTLTSETGEPGT